MDEGQVLGVGDPVRGRGGGVEIVAFEHDTGTVMARVLDLGERRMARHDNRDGNAETAAVIGDALGVIAGRDRDHAGGRSVCR